MKTLIQTSKVLILSIAVLTAVSYVQAEWNSAPAYDPSDSGFNEDIHNAPTPINVATSSQVKTGNITANVIGANGFCLNDDCIEEWPGGSGDTTNLQNRVTGTCEVGQSIIEINEDGTVVCGDTPGGAEVLPGTLCGYSESWSSSGGRGGTNVIPCGEKPDNADWSWYAHLNCPDGYTAERLNATGSGTSPVTCVKQRDGSSGSEE